jgi:hypothetical protein
LNRCGARLPGHGGQLAEAARAERIQKLVVEPREVEIV